MDCVQRALTDATNLVASQRRFIRAVTSDGRVVNGRRLNEDTFTVQLLDDRGRLVSLVKSELREYTAARTSPRPTDKDKLSAEDRAHLTAYLAALKGVPTGPVLADVTELLQCV